jgi:hypothetical protein
MAASLLEIMNSSSSISEHNVCDVLSLQGMLYLTYDIGSHVEQSWKNSYMFL